MNCACSVDDKPFIAIDDKVDATGDDCCVVPVGQEAPLKAACPVSGTMSKQVQRVTLESLLLPERRADIREVQYYFCDESDCPVVYFSNAEAPVFEVGDLSVKVYEKDSERTTNICYCFGWTRGRILEEIESHGKSTASDEIAAGCKAGKEDCEHKNPSGKCCLGKVRRFETEAREMV